MNWANGGRSLTAVRIPTGWPPCGRQIITERVNREKPADQFTLLRIAVEERGRRGSSEWRDDACSRRLGILNGVPETVVRRQRANINFYMLRDVRIRNAAEMTNGEVTNELARVSQMIGAGKTLLA